MKKLAPTFLPWAIFALVAVILAFQPASSQDLRVCPTGCEFHTIASAVQEAEPGAIVSVGPGEYKENIVLDKDLEIRGPERKKAMLKQLQRGRPIIAVGPSPNRVKVKNLTIHGASGEPFDQNAGLFSDGISVKGEARVIVTGSIISNNEGCGIRLEDKSRAEVVNSTLLRNGRALLSSASTSFSLFNSRSTGNVLFLLGGSAGEIVGTRLSNHQKTALHMTDSASISLSESEVGTSEIGIYAQDFSSVDLTESEVYDTGDGLRLEHNSRGFLRSTTFSDCTSGLELRENSAAVVEDCKIVQNDHGIVLFGKSKLEIKNCRLARNDIAIRVQTDYQGSVTGCGLLFTLNKERNVQGLPRNQIEGLDDQCPQ